VPVVPTNRHTEEFQIITKHNSEKPVGVIVSRIEKHPGMGGGKESKAKPVKRTGKREEKRQVGRHTALTTALNVHDEKGKGRRGEKYTTFHKKGGRRVEASYPGMSHSKNALPRNLHQPNGRFDTVGNNAARGTKGPNGW